MSNQDAWNRIMTYLAENKIKKALEAKLQQKIVTRTIEKDDAETVGEEPKEIMVEGQKLDYIFYDELLGFEKDPNFETKKIQAQDPLEEINLWDESIKRPTYISSKISREFKVQIISLLKKYKVCFARDYNEIPGLSRNVVELKLPIRPYKKPVKQLPRRFAPQIMSNIKEEIVERLLKSKFIRTARYVEWLANIVPIIKKNGTLRVCIDFRDMNNDTPEDEYPMPVEEMLVDYAEGFEYLSMLDSYYGYNQIFIAEEDVSKTTFQCTRALGTYESVVMSFGLKNAGVTYRRVMNLMFQDFIDKFMQIYIDDIVVKSSSKDDHLEHL